MTGRGRSVQRWCVVTSLALTSVLAGCSGGGGDASGGTGPGNDAAVALAFTAQPAGAVPGAAFAIQPVVEVRNSAGVRVSSSATVTLSLRGGPAHLLGAATINAVNGVATFTGLAVDSAAAGLALVATSPTLDSAVSQSFAAGPAMHLVFATAPANGVVTAPLAPAPVVEIRDSTGSLVKNAVTVTVAAATNTAGATLSGTTSITTDSGRAVFTDLAFDKAPASYALRATAAGAVAATSPVFALGVGVPSIASDQELADSILALNGTTVVTARVLDGKQNPITGFASRLSVTVTVPYYYAGADTIGAEVSATAFSEISPGVYTATITATHLSTPWSGTFWVPHGPAFPRYLQAGFDTAGFHMTLRAPGVRFYVLPTVPGHVGAVSAGWRHTCAISDTGSLQCWGSDTYGQAGIAGTSATTPQDINGGGTWTAVSAGYFHSCGIKTGGAAWCWGNDDYGQLGDNTQNSGDTPRAVSGGLSFAQVSTSLGIGSPSSTLDQGFTTCGVTTGGTAYCWGDNRNGQAGYGDSSSILINETHVPTVVAEGGTYASIATGPQHSCGITTGGTGRCWGFNANGQLASADPVYLACGSFACAYTPVNVAGSPFTPSSISVGYGSTCALKGTAAYCWGALGSGGAPVAVVGGHAFSMVSVGGAFACGVTTGSAAYCWGTGPDGQLGDGNSTSSSTPVLVAGGYSFASVSAGDRHACGVTTDRHLYCWGANDYGQLGDGTTNPRPRPVIVE